MAYSRAEPSPRFRALIAMYETMHEHGAPEYGIAAQNMFNGASLAPHLPAIRELATETGARSMIDYGSGKAMLYQARDFDLAGQTVPSVKAYLNMDTIRCFDPGVPEFSTLPSEKHDGVVSTDVLEHIPEEDLPWVLEEMFSLASKFVFANIANYPAAKLLPNGENAHVTQRPASWWRGVLRPITARHPHVRHKILVEEWETPKRLLPWQKAPVIPASERRYKYTSISPA